MNLGLDDLMIIASVFVLAGLVKGMIGLGLPTIAMGLLGERASRDQVAGLVACAVAVALIAAG